METQSASGNHYSASSLAESLAKLNKLTSEYGDRLLEIKEAANNLSSKELKGCLNCERQLINSIADYYGNIVEADYHWVATGIKYSTDNLSGMVSTVNALRYYIQKFEDTYGALDGTDDILENLACQIEKYQNDINNTLSGETKKNALKGMIGVVFASNKYDAKSKNGISENKVSTDLENWDGDLKFERQDNGTYLVIKVGKDGSEVPMGYTTKEGKNAYYKEAKKKVLGPSNEKNKSSKEKTTSSKEKTTSSKEKTTSSKEENIASNSNSKSTYASSDDISHNLSQKFSNRFKSVGLTGSQKEAVSKKFAADLRSENKTKNDLEGCSIKYSIETESDTGKTIVSVKATKRSSSSIYANNNEEIVFSKKYYSDDIVKC